MMLRNASLRFLRDGGYQLLSQRLPVGYSENVLPLIRKFCSASTESLSDSKVNDEFPYQSPLDEIRAKAIKEFPDQEATEMFHFDSETSPGDVTIGATNKGFKKQGAKNRHGTKANRALHPSLFQIVLDTSRNFLISVLDKWIQDGNRLERDEILRVLFHLRKQRMYSKALQFVEWIYRGKLLNFEEWDYGCHLDLIVRNHGIEAAQKYVERVPKPFKSQVLYETLLVSCVRLTDVQKAEEVFQEIRNHSLTVSACNQMLLLYKRVARTKVADILMLMEKENVKPSLFTYKLLIDLKQRSNDTLGMEAVLDTMKTNGVEPDVATQTMVAKFYISGGLTEKAEEAIRVMEVNKNDNRCAIRSLLDLYAILGRPNDVAKIWKSCVEPNLDDYLAAIEAWGKLGHIEQAEEILEALLKTTPKLTSKYINAMLNVYAENKLLAKGKNFLERMCSAGCPSGPLTWDALVNLYVNSGEVAKADSFLLKVTEKIPDRYPLFRSHIKLLKAYAEKGDIHNAEKIFDRLKKMRYPGRTPPYEFLLEAYVNAEVPAYGFWKRMRADNVRPSKTVIKQLNYLGNLQKGGSPEVVE